MPQAILLHADWSTRQVELGTVALPQVVPTDVAEAGAPASRSQRPVLRRPKVMGHPPGLERTGEHPVVRAREVGQGRPTGNHRSNLFRDRQNGFGLRRLAIACIGVHNRLTERDR